MGQFKIVKLGIMLGLGMLVLPAIARADTAPRSGTFTGYYHRDQLGVGHFRSYYVSPDLHEKLAEHAGKLIRLEVIKARQEFNPGPAIILEIGEIKELPQPVLRLSLRTRPNPVVAGQPFEVLFRVTDTRQPGAGEAATRLAPDPGLIRFRQPQAQPGPGADEPSWLMPKYTTRQLAVDEKEFQLGQSEWPFERGRSNVKMQLGWREVELSPGESWTWVASFPANVVREDGEIQVRGRYHVVEGGIPGKLVQNELQIEAWHKVTVLSTPLAQTPANPEDAVLRIDEVKLTPTSVEGWNDLQFRLLPAVGKKVRVPALGFLDRAILLESYASIARLDAFQSDGTPVEVEVERPPEKDFASNTRSTMTDLPKAGVIVHARFRKSSRFAPAIKKLAMSFVTEQGAETLRLSEDFHDPDVTGEIPFGAATDGVKIRIRPAHTELKTGMPLTFYVQAVNAGGMAICWWKPITGFGENVIVELDGEPLDLPKRKAEYIGGWGAMWTVQNPNEWTVRLPETIQINEGKHTLRYIIVSDGGTYLNANHKSVPLVKGRILSNTATFTTGPD